MVLPTELTDAARLDDWLLRRCKKEKTQTVPERTIQQYSPVRNRKRLDAALAVLEEYKRLWVQPEGRSKTVKLNPALLEGAP